MDYEMWSREYSDTAEAVQRTIDKLKQKMRNCSAADRLEIESKIRRYMSIRNDCRETANILLRRAAA